MSTYRFPEDFTWGVSTAAYQVEGAAYEGGKGLCNWDVFCKKPGKINGGRTGDVASDEYHHLEEDIALLKELGVNAYRFSINWARILPEGIGRINEEGAAYYNRLIDGCLRNGIEPLITLFHFDYPQALEEKGSWQNPESPYWFEEYADVVGRLFADRVKRFITINEPSCYLGLGYGNAYFPPGVKLTNIELVPMAHRMLLGHGLAVKKLQSYGCQVGYAPCGDVAIPDSDGDVEACRKKFFECSVDGFYNSVSWWSDPILLGKYPDVPELTRLLPAGWEDDLKVISTPLDFYCQNIYGGTVYKASDNEKGIESVKRKNPVLTVNMNMSPKAIYWGVKFLYERYQKPVMITENGMANTDWKQLDGKVHDPQRVDYIRRYLRELHRAMKDGVKVIGYCHWSFMDNFEWCSAETFRFGLVYVDYDSLERTPKDSFYAYQSIIKNGLCCEV